MNAAPEAEHLPSSMLELFTSMLTAELGAGTARRWADDMLTAGVSSDALVELAPLGDHEQGKAAALLPQALRDAGIETEPRGPLLVLFHRLLLRAWLDGRLELDGLNLLPENCLAFEPGTEGIGEGRRSALTHRLDTLTIHRAYRADSEGCPVVEEADVAAAARAALVGLSA